ncbi:hypothetical protein ABZ400_32400 [Streptomyces sp. NPDC005897]|uniref:hypothetical protein n=1 Tax=Streptomyces sp. NPDC005897 TaxID=3157081 RepID=UPI0033E66F72
MTSARSASPSGARLNRVVALTAGATLGLGVLCSAPPATAGHGGSEATDTVALTADTVAPSVTLGATTVQQGGEVPFTATGFPAGGKLSVKFDDKTLLEQFTIDDGGSVSGSVTVPADASAGGGRWLRFLAPQTSVRSEDLTVTAASAAPTPSPTPPQTPKPAADPEVRLTGGSRVAAGDKVSFTLSGFVKGQSVTVKFDDSEILARWPNAVTADGTFSGAVTVPASAPAGQHWLRVLAPEPATSLKAGITVTSSTDGGSAGGSGGSGSGSGGGSGSGSGGDTGSGSGGDTGGSGGSSDTTGSSGTGSGGATAGASATITAGTRVAAGGRVSFRVSGFPSGQQLAVKLDDSEILGQWTVGSDGSYSGGVTVPADATKGAHWLRFLAPNPATTLKVEFTVVTAGADGAAAPPAPASSTTAPDTTVGTLAAASAEAPVSYATIAWSAAAAAAGGAAGAAATALFVVRRRTTAGPAAGV